MNVESKLIQSKLGLLKLAEKIGNVSEACRVYGYSRGSPPPRFVSPRTGIVV